MHSRATRLPGFEGRGVGGARRLVGRVRGLHTVRRPSGVVIDMVKARLKWVEDLHVAWLAERGGCADHG